MPTKVLVADDSPTIRRRAAATLGDAGFAATCVEHGEAAWAALEGGLRPDVVLCDILMPELDGYDLCARIRADERFKELPVVLLRGTFEPWDQEKAEAVGADAFIAKPFDPDSLIGTLREVLEAAGTPTEAGAAPAAAEPAAEARTLTETDLPIEEPAPPASPLAEPEPIAAPAPPAPEPIAAPAMDEGPFASEGLEAMGEVRGNPLDELLPAASEPGEALAAPSAGPPVSLDGLDDATLDRLAEKIVARLTTDQIEKIAWEVVPEVAEALVRKRIIEIESRLES